MFKLLGLVLTLSLLVMFLVAGCQTKQEKEKKPAAKPVAKSTAKSSGKTEKASESVLPPIEEGFKNCTYCHGSIDYGQVKEKVFGRKLLTFTHLPHINMGTKCSVCHKLPVHRKGIKVVKGEVNRPAMHLCYNAACHGLAGAKASGNCELCHPAGFNLKPAAGSQYGDHLAANFLPPEHAKLYKTAVGKNCAICHAGEFCNNCHGMEMPHQAAFKTSKQHGQLAKQNMDACTKCHPDYNWCEKCHHKGYDPLMGPWATEAHPIIVNRQGAEGCFKCHKPSYAPFCANCHVKFLRR